MATSAPPAATNNVASAVPIHQLDDDGGVERVGGGAELVVDGALIGAEGGVVALAEESGFVR